MHSFIYVRTQPHLYVQCVDFAERFVILLRDPNETLISFRHTLVSLTRLHPALLLYGKPGGIASAMFINVHFLIIRSACVNYLFNLTPEARVWHAI